MKLWGYKNQVIGWLMIWIGAGFIPLAFSDRLITPFLLTPDSEVEVYNYAAGIIIKLRPLIILHLLYFSLVYFSKVNIDDRLNHWILDSTKDIMRVVLAMIFYQVKEVFDYLFFENVVPECFDDFWFLIIWELGSIVLLMTWAFLTAKRERNGP